MFRVLSLVSGILCLTAVTVTIGRSTFLEDNSYSFKPRAAFEGTVRGRDWKVFVSRRFEFCADGGGVDGYPSAGIDRRDEKLEFRSRFGVFYRWPQGPWGYRYFVGLDITVVAGLLAILPCVAVFRIVRARRLPGPGECAKCRYLLRGLTSDRCPECGTPFDSAQLEQQLAGTPAIDNSVAPRPPRDVSDRSAAPVPAGSGAPEPVPNRSLFHRVRRLFFLTVLTCVTCYPPLCIAANLFYAVPSLEDADDILDDTLEDLKPDLDRRAIGELDQDCRRAVIAYVMRTSHWIQGFAKLFPDAIHCLRGTSDENTWWTSRVLLYGRYQIQFTTSTAWTDRERCELALAESFDFHVLECVRREPDPTQPGEYIYDHTGNVLSETFSRDEYEAFLDANGDFGVLGIELITDEPIPYCDTGFEDMKDFYGPHCVD